MGSHRETCGRYTAEMLYVGSNPKARHLSYIQCNMLPTNNTRTQIAAAASDAIRGLYPNLVNLHARTDGWGRCRIWAECHLPSGEKQRAVARGKGAATAVRNFIDRINAQPELRKAATAL